MKKKVLSLLLAVVMTFSLAVTANAAEETAQDLDGDIVILHTNDVHGAISGYAKVAALKDAYEARGAYVLLMDAGDFIQGDPTVSTSEGATAVELMNLAGYDVASMGNHEFDYGYQNLKDLEADADFTIVDANVLYNGQVAFEDNVVFTAPDGTKIGVFGLDTPETATKAHPAKIQGVTFLAGDKMFDCAQDQVDALEAEGCEYIICLGHLGIDDESIGNRSIDVCEHVDGIDLFIDGHSHSTTADIIAKVGDTNVVNGAKIVSTGTALANVGVVIYDQETGTLTDELVPAASYTKTDADVAKLVDDRNTAVDKVYGEKIATTEVDLNGSRSGGAATDPVTKAEMTFPEGEGVRTTETNLGDFAADAILWQARQTLGEENVDAYYLEFDDDRSGDFAPLAEVSGDKKVVLGLITSKKPDLEDPDTIKARIQEAAQYIPLDRLCLSTQCGFASTQEGNKLTEDQQWAKIALVQSIAKDVWGE